MNKDKRKGNIPVPDNLKEMLNEAQWRALSGIQFSGWKLHCLRRPLFQETVLVLHNPVDGRMGTLDKDGHIVIQQNIKVRERGNRTQTLQPNESLIWTK